MYKVLHIYKINVNYNVLFSLIFYQTTIILHIAILFYFDLSLFVFFMTVTLDYKALIMLLKRRDDGDDESTCKDGLCKRGLDTECCFLCKVIRVG